MSATLERSEVSINSEPRGCGMRIAGGVYLEAMISEDGTGVPFASTIVCPPAPVDVNALGLSPIGVKLIEVNGVWHVFDWVGSNNYPTVASFVDEARERGISRRIAKTSDFDLITPASRLILIHAQAGIANIENAVGVRMSTTCPAGHDEAHDDRCLGVSFPDFEPIYTPAIFMSVPISQIAVINDPIDGTHRDALAKLHNAKLPVVLENT